MAKKSIVQEFTRAALDGGGIGARLDGRSDNDEAKSLRYYQMTVFVDEDTKRRFGLMRLDRGGKYKDHLLQALKEYLDRLGY